MADAERRTLVAGGEEFTGRRLPGGLEAWVWRRKGFQNRHAAFATRFGAMDALFEVGGERFEVPDGTAHFLEHMAFETDKGNALGLFSKLGVRSNAFTSHSVTTFYFSGTDNFWTALDRLTGLVVTSRLTPQGVENEKRVIAQEVRMYEDSPDSKALENLLEALYASHPIRRRIAGTVESVEGITPEVLLRCHRTFYHPSNLVFVAAGDLEPERVFDTVGAALEKLGVAGPGPAFRRLYPDEPALPAARDKAQPMAVKRPTFLVGFKDPNPSGDGAAVSGAPAGGAAAALAGAGDPAANGSAQPLFRREIVVNLLIEAVFGPTSPLYNDLYRQGLLDDSFSARYTSDRSFGYAVAGGTTPQVDRAVEGLLEGIHRWRPKGITEKELERKRRKARGQYVELADSLEGLATLFLMYRLKGIDLGAYPDVVGDISLDETNQAFTELFVPERVSVSAITPV